MKGLINTGNTIIEGCALDAEAHSKLEVGFKTRDGNLIGTAHKNGLKLRKEGVSNPIIMEINGFKFEIEPAVIQNRLRSPGINLEKVTKTIDLQRKKH